MFTKINIMSAVVSNTNYYRNYLLMYKNLKHIFNKYTNQTYITIFHLHI